MLIRLTTDRVAGYGVLQLAGSVIDVPDQDALRMLERGQAEFIEPEFAAVAPSEDASRHHSRSRRK